MDRLGLFFFICVIGIMNTLFGVIMSMFKETPVVVKESKKGLYSAGMYIFCRNLAELWITLLAPAIFVLCI